MFYYINKLRGGYNMPPQVVAWTASQSFQLGGHCACLWCGSSYYIPVPSLKSVGLPVAKIWLIFGHGVNRPDDLDLSTSKWGHGLASFLPIFSFLRPCVLDLGSGTEQTGWQRPSVNYAPPSLWGRGMKSLFHKRWLKWEVDTSWQLIWRCTIRLPSRLINLHQTVMLLGLVWVSDSDYGRLEVSFEDWNTAVK